MANEGLGFLLPPVNLLHQVWIILKPLGPACVSRVKFEWKIAAQRQSAAEVAQTSQLQ